MASTTPAVTSNATASFVPKGYQGFGSFHSDNVEELIRIPAETYQPPSRPVNCDDLTLACGDVDSHGSTTCFGVAMRPHFYLDPSWTFINHGAFGGACKLAMKASQRWAEYAEKQPLRFIDRELFALMCYSIRRLASLLGCAPTSLALVPNATYALTSIIGSFKLSPGDSVFMLDIGYGSVKKMLQTACDRSGASLVVGKVTFPTDREGLARQAADQVPDSCKLAVIDHITSNTGILMPIQEIIASIRAKVPDCRILIDGAHGLASQDLTLSAIDCDYYVSNCHKWLCSTKGLGCMYVAPRILEADQNATAVRAAVISHGYGSGYTSEFLWDGCRDYSMAVALPTLLDFWSRVGIDAARQYCRSLLRDAVALLTTTWGTSTHVPMDCYSHMACIQLPYSCMPTGAVAVEQAADAGGDVEGGVVHLGEWEHRPATAGAGRIRVRYSSTSTHGKMLQDALHYAFKIECPVKTLQGPCGNNRSYVRISAMVYNSIDDYKRLADAVTSMQWKAEGALAVADSSSHKD